MVLYNKNFNKSLHEFLKHPNDSHLLVVQLSKGCAKHMKPTKILLFYMFELTKH